MEPYSLISSTYGLIALLAILCFLYLYYRFGYAPFSYFTSQAVPGPKPKPFIGSLLLLKKFQGNLSLLSAYLLETYGHVSGIYFGTKPFLFVSDLDMVKEIMVKHFDKFVDHMNSGGGFPIRVDGKGYEPLFNLPGEKWKKRRPLISPAFSSHKIKLMEPLIKKSTVRLVEKVSVLAEKEETVEVLGLVRQMTIEVMLSTAFGRSVDVQGGKGGELYEAARGALLYFTGQQAVSVRLLVFFVLSFPRLGPILEPLIRMSGVMNTFPQLVDFAVKMIEMRKKEENKATLRKDLLQLLVDSGDELESGEIVAEAVGFLLAGHEVTAYALTFTTYLLAKNPQVQEKLVGEIEEYLQDQPEESLYDAMHKLQYLDMVVNESLRVYPPAPATLRLCNQDCAINGVTIKAGVQVIIPMCNIHKDPDCWPEPEEFIPERFTEEEKTKRHPCAYLPFGYGPRNCVGMRFALMEMKMVLIEIVRNFKIELSKETEEPLELEDGGLGTIKPKNGVRVRFYRR